MIPGGMFVGSSDRKKYIGSNSDDEMIRIRHSEDDQTLEEFGILIIVHVLLTFY
jgi:hypothetical protein